MESTSLRVMFLTADCLTILIVEDDTTGIDGGVLEPMPCVAKANSTAAKNALEGIFRRLGSPLPTLTLCLPQFEWWGAGGGAWSTLEIVKSVPLSAQYVCDDP